MRYSSSHNEDEIAWLHQLLTTLNRGGDIDVLRKSPMLTVWLKKAVALKERAEGRPPTRRGAPHPAQEPKPRREQQYRPTVRRTPIEDAVLPLGDDDD